MLQDSLKLTQLKAYGFNRALDDMVRSKQIHTEYVGLIASNASGVTRERAQRLQEQIKETRQRMFDKMTAPKND